MKKRLCKISSTLLSLCCAFMLASTTQVQASELSDKASTTVKQTQDMSETKATRGCEFDHRWKTIMYYEATCTEYGYQHVICMNCMLITDVDFRPALGHNFVNGSCTRCSIQE